MMISVAMVVMMMGTLEELTGGTNNEAIVQLARAHVHHAAEVLRVLQCCKYCYCVNPNATKFRKYWKSASAYNGVTPLVWNQPPLNVASNKRFAMALLFTPYNWKRVSPSWTDTLIILTCKSRLREVFYSFCSWDSPYVCMSESIIGKTQ